LFSGLEGFQDALEDLKQCYEDICKKIDKKIDEETRAMFGLVENDNDEFDDEVCDMEGNTFTEIPWDYEREEWLEEMDGYIHEFEEYRRDYN
jgi:hypothetical protein